MKIHYKLMTGVLVHDISSYDLISSCEITFAQTFQTNPCNDFNIVTWINFVVHNATDFYRTQVSLGSDLWVQLSETNSDTFVQTNLTDEDTNSILTDNANKAFQSNMAMQLMQLMQLMQVAPSGGQFCN